MGIKARREREKEQLKQAILEAAEDLILHEGYEKLSMRKIAEKIEYSTTTIYIYYKNKEEIIHHLIHNIYIQVLNEFNKAFKKEPKDPVKRLCMLMNIYITFGFKHPSHYKMLFITDVFRLKQNVKGLSGLEAFQLIVQTVEQCINDGHFRAEDPVLISQGIWANMHGITSLLIVRPDFPWVDINTLVDYVIKTTIHGLKK